ncbi:MAG TPA: 30S ribosomal protein S20, partial [Longimicrobiales bacterium]|nr:30S ribosomal protein S20 [Longimicrobiales bacterium]
LPVSLSGCHTTEQGHMANTRSAKKRNRQDIKRNERNRSQRSRMRTAIKKVTSETDQAKADEEFKTTAALLDRLATRRLIHPNKAARKKSQLAKAVKNLGK